MFLQWLIAAVRSASASRRQLSANAEVEESCVFDAQTTCPDVRRAPREDRNRFSPSSVCRSEPLPPQPPRRAHGPYVEETSHWFVVDDIEDYPGMGLVKLNPETAIVVEAPDAATTRA